VIFDAIFVAAIFLLGAGIGSFLNVVVLRFGKEQGASRGRSRCPHCERPLNPMDLVPVFSFIFLRGRCRYCDKSISPQYPIIELIMGFSALVFLWPLPADWYGMGEAAANLTLIFILLVLFVIDLRTFLLPDYYIVLLTVAVVVRQSMTMIAVNEMQLGTLTGAGLMLALWLATRGRGLGLGDVKLIIPLGMLFGLPGTLFLLFMSFVLGGAVGSWLLATGRASAKTAVPFGPYLTGVSLTLLVWPQLPHLFWEFLLGI